MTNGIEAEGSSSGTFLDGLKIYLASPEFQEDLKREGSVARQFVQKLEVLVPVVQALGERLSAWTKTEDFQQLARGLAEAEKWAKGAPQKLREALANEGLVPHPLAFSLAELRELTSIFDEKGPRAAAEHLTAVHDVFLRSSEFRRESRDRWERRGRWQVFSDILSAFDANLYSVAIPPALAQAEGIIAHLFNLKGMNFPMFKQKVMELHEDESELFGPLIVEVLNGLLEKFEHGAPVAKLNRHAVLHGADSNYGTRENAVAAIVWADYIMFAASEYKAIAIPRTGKESAVIMAKQG